MTDSNPFTNDESPSTMMDEGDFHLDEIEPDIVQVVQCCCSAIDKATDNSDLSSEVLFSMYQNEWWQLLETLLTTTEQWSVQRRLLHQNHHEAQGIVADLQRLVLSTSRQTVQERLTSQLLSQEEIVQMNSKIRISMPQHLKITSIKENDLETRWDAHGKPQFLRRNVFGESFASIHHPLRFIHQRTPTQIYTELKPRLRANAKAYEIQRIQKLNERKYSILA